MTEDVCAIWLRVSTTDQSADNQLPELRALAAHRGWRVGTVYYIKDSAWQDKPGAAGEYDRIRAEMLRDAHAGKFTHLLVWSLDRLTRRGIEDAFALIRQLRDSGVQLVSAQDSWLSTTDPFALEIMTAIFASVARFESARRSERVKAGLARRKAAGLPIGGKPGRKDKQPRRRSGYVAAWEPGGERRAAAS